MQQFLNKLRIKLRPYNTLYFIFAARYHDLRIFWYGFFLSKLEGIVFIKPVLPQDNYMSQYGQDRALEKLGLLVEGGVFVEVGSNHPILNSNTYYLETCWKYSGISIDPIDYSRLFIESRPNTKFFNVAIDASMSFVDMNFVENISGWEDQVSSVYDNVLTHGRGFKTKKMRVSAQPLSEVCKDLSSIDILLLDVEGHEISVLESLDWDKYRPAVILTENTGDFYPRKILRDYLQDKKYTLLARIGASDEIYIDRNRSL